MPRATLVYCQAGKYPIFLGISWVWETSHGRVARNQMAGIAFVQGTARGCWTRQSLSPLHESSAVVLIVLFKVKVFQLACLNRATEPSEGVCSSSLVHRKPFRVPQTAVLLRSLAGQLLDTLCAYCLWQKERDYQASECPTALKFTEHLIKGREDEKI